ncbi:hypothetical protein CJ030_MR8G004369 [Morella rubra]|uniref:RPW8 domain-containing protein n=1 Tax=Morella rubra TaxID=262757 RepID=A0A6A1UNP4_9ROSI|nr:hypothetical protein CJ030_MR8G004369 [Morella rubra]
MAEALGSAVLGTAVSKLWDTVEDVIKTIPSFKDELKSLQSTLAKLKPVIEQIERSHRELRRPEEEIEGLIKQINKGEDHVRKCSTLRRWNYYKRYSYTKKLHALDQEIIRFFQLDAIALSWRTGEENSLRLQEIFARLHLAERDGGWVSYSIPGPPEFSVGLDVHLKELKMQLLKEEVSLLLLTAPGGCGKTTLVKLLGHDEEIKDVYKGNLYFVTVSKTPNLMVIIQTLFDQKGDRVLEFQSDEDAINKLEQYLLKRIADHPILLILDDVWSDSFVKKFEFDFRIPNYKILVTSRIKFPVCKFIYELRPLNDEDSMTLFRHSANLQDTSSFISEEDVKKIVKRCGGFPLAIKLIGRSLNGRPAAVWHKSVTSDHSILRTAEDLLRCFQSSIDLLDEEITNCFMDLGSFPEDQRIRVDALIDMWSELYKRERNRSNDKGFREKIMKDAMNAIGMLDEIAMRNLASFVVTRKDASCHDVGCYCTEDFVLQHDLLRELAIQQSSKEPLIEHRKRLILDISGNNVLDWWTEQREQPINAFLLSITTDEMFSSSNWCNILPTKVEVLVLNFHSKKYILPEFVEKMEKLKVLIVTNHGFFPADLGNFQLLGSAPNLKRIRLEKVSVHSLWETPVQLKSLEKMSLFMCNIGQAFTYGTIQVSEVLPNLTEINIDYCKDMVKLPVALCGIVHLKKLSITNCHNLDELPEEIGMLVNLEVLRLRSCTDLSKLPDSITNLHMLSMLDISDCLKIRGLPKQIGELKNLEELHMKGCSQLGRLPESTKDLAKLELVICDEEGKQLWAHVKEEFLPNLKIKVAEKDINLNWLITNRF